MEKIVIFGNSLFAETVYFCLSHDSPFSVAAFTVDGEYVVEDKLLGLPVVPFEDVESVFSPSQYKMIISVSFQKVNRLREEKYLQAKAKGYELISYICSKASVWPGLVIGDNCIIGENSQIGPFVEIGNNVTVASGVTIGHHVILKDHSFVAPAAVILGGVTVEPYCLIGANSTIREDITVARECVIGSGVSITKNTVEKGVYVEQPPMLQSKRSDELSRWLMWSVKPGKPRWGSGRKGCNGK